MSCMVAPDNNFLSSTCLGVSSTRCQNMNGSLINELTSISIEITKGKDLKNKYYLQYTFMMNKKQPLYSQ